MPAALRLTLAALLFAAAPVHAQVAPADTTADVPVPTAAPHAQAGAGGMLRFARWAVSDVGAVASEVTLPRVGLAAGFVGLLSVASMQDDAVGRAAPEMYTDDSRGLLQAVNHVGDPRALSIAAGLFAATLATDDARLQDAAFTSLQAGLYASLVSNTLKGVAGRARPYQREGPYAFAPFSGNTSFPSGHTTLAFALVTPWVVYYPGPLTYGLLAVSTGTAVARVALERHWATDVLAGAALGSVTGYWLARRHLDAAGGFQITPSLGPHGGAVALTYRF